MDPKPCPSKARETKQKNKENWNCTSYVLRAIFENLEPRSFWLVPLVGDGYQTLINTFGIKETQFKGQTKENQKKIKLSIEVNLRKQAKLQI